MVIQESVVFLCVEACVMTPSQRDRNLKWLLEAERNLLIYLTHAYRSDEEVHQIMKHLIMVAQQIVAIKDLDL